MTVLRCTPETLLVPPAPASEAVTLQRVDAYSGPDALRDLAVAGQLTPGDADPSDADVAALTARVGDGLGILARVGAGLAGGGFFTTPQDDHTAITAIGVLDPHRDGGLEAVLAAELARLAFRTGVRVVTLDIDGPDAAARYAPAGFTAADPA